MGNNLYTNKEEIDCLKYSYERTLDMFRLNNDNYFKRVQIIMMAFKTRPLYMFAVYKIRSFIRLALQKLEPKFIFDLLLKPYTPRWCSLHAEIL